MYHMFFPLSIKFMDFSAQRARLKTAGTPDTMLKLLDSPDSLLATMDSVKAVQRYQ